MKALKLLTAAAVLTTTFAAAAQTATDTRTAAPRDEAFGLFVYERLGATPKVELKGKAPVKAEAKVEDKAVATAQANEARTVHAARVQAARAEAARAEAAYTH